MNICKREKKQKPTFIERERERERDMEIERFEREQS
jgi:hypothetical protein